MDALYNSVQYILGFGPTVILPLVMFVVGLCFRLKVSRALRAALTIGVGFVGIYAVFGVFTDTVSPAAMAMVENAGINLPVADLGWPPLSAITWGTPIAPVVILTTIIINIIMLAFRWTKTVDVDLWNYWHFALVGAFVYYSTGSFWMGIAAACIITILTLKLADWSAPLIGKEWGLEGVSFPTVSSAVFFPVGLLGNWIIDKIPGLRDVDIKPENVQKRFGVFGEPLMIGTILGAALGIAAGYDVQNILTTAINVGGVMFLLPRMVSILMEGLLPISDAVRDFLNKRYEGADELYVGLDHAIAAGQSSVISTGLLLVPIALIIAVILPGNRVLPLGDLSNLALFSCMMVLACGNNIFRAIIISLPMLVVDLYVATDLAPLITKMAQEVNFSLPEDGGLVSSFLDGGNPLRYWIYQIFNGNMLALIGVVIGAGIIYVTYKITYKQTRLISSESEKK
ncbi:PTS galactitol transporter subunit IIC [Aerococcus mictus]|uniref:PTS galactitol transporter subunit IIC n=1 Tax=Aerococcus mictus TaxID=2976810 RepID=UPI000DCB2253|nr:PTS galactitol transporter subunit IIC [Aerococcus mictus]KAA9233754.1 PTS galactitol transporter subunit IIC [Aerococcus mictus]MDL5183865.1 PTS galactitol transporter subunit IIC [Aerococcus mictus]